MSSEMIIFQLQWKKKAGRNSEACFGFWDIDASIDWITFKSYVSHSMGTTEDLHISYIDSDGDELPIESECEFQEALKFARMRASKEKDVILKLDKINNHLSTPSSSERKDKGLTVVPSGSNDLEKHLKRKQVKINGKMSSKSAKDQSSEPQSQVASGVLPRLEKKKFKIEDKNILNEISKKLACVLCKLEKSKKEKVDKDDSPPAWFKKYMQKFKSEIVAEITTSVICNTRQLLENDKVDTHSICPSCCERNAVQSTATKTKKKKKKISEDDSSDCAVSSDQRDHKLLKKIEKLHKREKKLEKKLDSKLEKLENKTKRRMEKKSQHKSCSEQLPEKKNSSGSKKRVTEMPIGTYLMDAIPVSDGHKTADLHIKLGESFTKVWEIMNNGILPWTDKTELRLAWGTSGLEPEVTTLKCPILMPGDKGEIAVTFRAPEFPGTFESYWHFYHMGDRFGHWLGCAAVVDSKEPDKELVEICSELSSSESAHSAIDDKEECKPQYLEPVQLRMTSEPEKMVDTSITKSVENLCIKLNEEKCEETTSFENVKDIAEYESDTDDEHLSIISGTISMSSDSEDETFVVVPMPACFMCDVPLEKSGTAPLDVNENLKETETSAEIVEEVPQNTMPNDEQYLESKIENEEECDSLFTECDNEEELLIDCDKSHFNKETPEQEEEEAKFVSFPSNVFAVDMEGHCIPVNSTWSSNTNKTDPKDESELESKQTKRTSTHVHAAASAPFVANFQTGHVGKGQNCNTKFTHETFSSSNGFQASSNKNSTTTNTSFQNSSANCCNGSPRNQVQDPQGTSVHILPETLVTGAINVASQAYTTARAVFNNLRARPSEEFAGWHWDERTAEWAPQTDRSTSESLKILLEMGFPNKILNVLLLQRYDNNIAKVVAELLAYKTNSEFVYDSQTQ